MKDKTKVYIASPYSLGDIGVNVKNHMDMFEVLTEEGYLVLAPLWSHFQHIAHPRSYEFWIEYTLAWLDACDVVYRMPGDSSGADGEVAYAKKHNIPVFYTVEELNQHIKSSK